MNDGLLLLRAVTGLMMAAHGSQKLFGWFGGYGLPAIGGFFETIGFRPGRVFAVTAAAAEFFGGLLIAVGFLGPIGPAVVLATMIVAAVSVHWQNGLFATTNGIELPLLYGTMVAALALTGPGAYSIDGAFGFASFWTRDFAWAALAVGVIGGVANLAARRPAPPVEA